MSKTIEEIIKKILNADSPVNIEGEIKDLDDFEIVMWDGSFSSRGFKYLYNPKTNCLLYYKWSNWQGESCYYDKTSIDDYMEDMMSGNDEQHFNRFVEGLKKIFTLKNQE